MIGSHVLRPVIDAATAMANTLALQLAGHIAYTGLLAIFPFLIFLASLAGFLGVYVDSIAGVNAVFGMLPTDVARTLKPVINEVLRTQDGGLLTLGLLGALWVASNAFDALRIALNAAYEFDEPRPWWLMKLGSIGAVVIGGIVFILLSVLIIFGPLIWKGILYISPLSQEDRWAYSLLRYSLASTLLFLTVLALHRWLPGHRMRFRALLPGALATTVLWLAGASLFSLYVANLGNYSATYGSLGGVIITLLFFYISAVLFIFGAELNAALLRCKGVPPPAEAVA
ncbi:MAG TPA: YihY/virulence factor BrkB family protein [Ferrovibrio sp.]|uniref:YihY/virulence factor BrkB family protein n=1 Tax=Ferrovibrio sp. TaxID=1917215 RepID=UPI002B4B4039|nr:YihY/virulence factor BrkB family protein [Ferrovibrio sp.]HLT75995.1 YihY/virulence factor BrkB family protein [Ferrovibrio sp.]